MFLPPRLFARSTDLTAALRACGALPKRRKLHDHCGMNQRPMRLRAEYGLAHLNGTDGLPRLIYDFYRGHADALPSCLSDKDQPSHGTGNGSPDENEMFLRSSAGHGQSFHRDPLAAHLPGQCLVFQDTRGIRTAPDGPRRTMEHGAVTGRTASEIVALHDTLKSFSL